MRTSAPSTGNPALDRDIERLRRLGHEIEVLQAAPSVGVVIVGFDLPPGVYNKPMTDLLLQTTVQYPLSAMDMFWVEPELRLASGAVPAGGSIEMQFERPWLRFSWHRNAPWVPGRDDLLSHLEFAEDRLRRGN